MKRFGKISGIELRVEGTFEGGFWKNEDCKPGNDGSWVEGGGGQFHYLGVLNIWKSRV